MPLEPTVPLDTRGLFRPVSSSLVALLRGLPDEQWHRPTVARRWVVRDVVAHLLDSTLRRLSFHRDRMAPPPPTRAKPRKISCAASLPRSARAAGWSWASKTGSD